eukprot:GFKZ01015717.1.p1 GENE.GFKZ01015717.1~~GFKZ01015717.1.p1  ORF type:complete len:275 (+),score=38.08 GFKZ01015717.1:142-966(+)
MSASAFISSFTPLSFNRPLKRPLLAPLSPYQSRTFRRSKVFASTETEGTPTTESPKTETTTTPQSFSTPSFEAPSFDTQVFSRFVDQAQSKIDDLGQKVQNIDTDEVLDSSKAAAVGLVDNLLAGDWLNRGELYGAIQVVFVLLLLRAPGSLDALISFLCGPLILFVGAGISGKALWDLGRKQLSIWPSPVPGAELRVEGVYEYVRHPMYSGLILASLGYAVATGSAARIAVTVAFGAFLMKKIEVEEQFLKETYPEYSEYCEKVESKILPGIY